MFKIGDEILVYPRCTDPGSNPHNNIPADVFEHQPVRVTRNRGDYLTFQDYGGRIWAAHFEMCEHAGGPW